MGLLQAAAAALALLAATAPTPVTAAKFCDGAVCYSEFVSPQRVAFRVAVPETAKQGTPFDVLIQIVAPRSVGWAGIAWGGQMANNPLTIAYSNGATGTVVSSRRATGRVAPVPYAGATYAVFSTSTTNSTHWRLDALCTGCSVWTGSTPSSINPAGTAVPLAYASSSRAPSTPASNTSTITVHDNKNRFSFDLAAGRIANFTEVVAAKKAGM